MSKRHFTTAEMCASPHTRHALLRVSYWSGAVAGAVIVSLLPGAWTVAGIAAGAIFWWARTWRMTP